MKSKIIKFSSKTKLPSPTAAQPLIYQNKNTKKTHMTIKNIKAISNQMDFQIPDDDAERGQKKRFLG